WHRMGAQPIETAGVVASFDPFVESMTVWSNTNMYNYIPWVFAQLLKVSTNRLKMQPCLVGGSFGSKHLITKCFAITGALTKSTGRPVKFIEDRVDNLAANDNVGPDRFYDAELAVAEDGTFLGLRLEIVDDYGAYFQFAQGQHGNALSQPTGPYRISSLEYGVKCVLTNKVQQGFFRGAGADPGNFALERLVDAAADELGMDRAEIRRKNFIDPEEFPYKTVTGNVYDSGNYARVLDRALSAGPGGSRLTIMLSGAARGASRRVKDKLFRIAAHLLEADVGDLELQDSQVRVKGAPTRSLSIGDVALKAHLFKLDIPKEE